MATINWDDTKLIQSAINNSKSRVEVLKNLGYNPKSSVSRRKLNAAIEKYNLDTSCFTNSIERWNRLPSVIRDCNSIGDVLKSVGLQDQGDNFKTAKRHIKEMGLDVSHFNTGGGSGSTSHYSHEEIFCENSSVGRWVVRRRVLKESLLPYECEKCKLTEWCGQEIALDLDHINGINNDHRLENLRFLCPNCHSLTPTHRGKNRSVVQSGSTPALGAGGRGFESLHSDQNQQQEGKNYVL